MECVYSKRYKRESPVSSSRQRLNQLLPISYAKYEELVREWKKLMRYRARTLSLMYWVADELDEKHRDVNIAKLVGSSVGVLGAAITGFGVLLTPFTFGAGAVAVVGGGSMIAAGTATSTGAHMVEKIIETDHLDKVQRAVDEDKKQCEKVKALWKEFENYCSKVINTILLADTSKEADMYSLKTWITVAIRETKSALGVIYAAFQEAETKGVVSSKRLLDILIAVAEKIPTRNFISVTGMCAFVVIASVGVGNLYVLITTAIDVHNGSLSKVARDIRKKYSLLKEEYDDWNNFF